MNNIVKFTQKSLAVRGIGREFVTLLDVTILDKSEKERAAACHDALMEAIRGDVVGQSRFWEFLMIAVDQVQYHAPMVKKGKTNKPAQIKDLFLGECNHQEVLDHFGLAKITTEHVTNLPGLQQPYKAGNVLQNAHDLGLELDARNFFPAYATANRYSAITALRNLIEDMTDKKGEKRADLVKDFTGEKLTDVVDRLSKCGKNWAEVNATEQLASVMEYAPPIPEGEKKVIDVQVSNTPATTNPNTPAPAPEPVKPETTDAESREPRTPIGLDDRKKSLSAAMQYSVGGIGIPLQEAIKLSDIVVKISQSEAGTMHTVEAFLRLCLAEVIAQNGTSRTLAAAARRAEVSHK
jgi:hypothetical protein